MIVDSEELSSLSKSCFDGDMCHDSLDSDPLDPKLWSFASVSSWNVGNGGTNPAWPGTTFDGSCDSSKYDWKKEKDIRIVDEMWLKYVQNISFARIIQ